MSDMQEDRAHPRQGEGVVTRPTPHPIANAGEGMREAVARVIDPEAWEDYSSQEMHPAMLRRIEGRQLESLAKADAILSLLPSAPEGDAAAMRSAVELLTARADEQDKSADLHFAEGRPWKANRFAASCLRDAAAAIRALPLPANPPAEGMVLVPREVLEPFFDAAEPIAHYERERWHPGEWSARVNLITVGQFRALRAAMIAASKGGA